MHMPTKGLFTRIKRKRKEQKSTKYNLDRSKKIYEIHKQKI